MLAAILFPHIAAGTVAILARYAALALRKGGSLHEAAGRTFGVAMLVMAPFAIALAMTPGQRINLLPGALTIYLTLTAWGAVRRKPGTVGRLEVAGCLFAGALAAAGLIGGLSAEGGPAQSVLLLFGALAMLAAALDLRMLRRGGLVGFERLRRHLWRMCTALFVAAGAFFLGQADEFPNVVRGPHLFILALTPLGALVFWMIRTRPRRRRDAAGPPSVATAETTRTHAGGSHVRSASEDPCGSRSPDHDRPSGGGGHGVRRVTRQAGR